VSCVVFPEPVSPTQMTTEEERAGQLSGGGQRERKQRTLVLADDVKERLSRSKSGKVLPLLLERLVAREGRGSGSSSFEMGGELRVGVFATFIVILVVVLSLALALALNRFGCEGKRSARLTRNTGDSNLRSGSGSSSLTPVRLPRVVPARAATLAAA
jgi:hypothetical protein